MNFLYKAKNNKSEIITGTVKAGTQYEAEKILVDHGLVSLEIIPERKTEFSFNHLGSRITIKDRAVFARQLATMISAGLPLTKAMTIIASQSRNVRLKEIYHSVHKELEEGYSFSGALSRHPEMFDRVFVSVINSGETTGKLEIVLSQLAVQLENDNNLLGKVKGILYYPAFIILALIGISIYMVVAIIPQLKAIFDQAQTSLPVATKILLSISDFVTHDWWLLIVILVLAVVILRIWLVSDAGARGVSYLQITIPGVKTLAVGLYVSRFARVMQMLVASGVPLLDALRTSSSIIDNQFFEEDILSITNKVEKGVPLSSELIKSPVFPQLLGQMVAVGEETGQLDQVLGKVAEYYEEETSGRIKTLSSLIEPIVLVIIGFAVAFLVFAILVPIFNLTKVT